MVRPLSLVFILLGKRGVQNPTFFFFLFFPQKRQISKKSRLDGLDVTGGECAGGGVSLPDDCAVISIREPGLRGAPPVGNSSRDHGWTKDAPKRDTWRQPAR